MIESLVNECSHIWQFKLMFFLYTNAAVDEPEPTERQINGYDRQPDFSEWLYQDWLANNKPNYPLQYNNYNWWHKNHRWWPKRKQWSYTKSILKIKKIDTLVCLLKTQIIN